MVSEQVSDWLYDPTPTTIRCPAATGLANVTARLGVEPPVLFGAPAAWMNCQSGPEIAPSHQSRIAWTPGDCWATPPTP